MHMKFDEVLYKALIFDRLSKKYLIDFIKLVSTFKVPLIFLPDRNVFVIRSQIQSLSNALPTSKAYAPTNINWNCTRVCEFVYCR